MESLRDMTQTSAAVAPEHHPAIRAFDPIEIYQDPEFLVDFLGIRTRVSFIAGMIVGYEAPEQPRMVTAGAPAYDEEYFEWIDVLEAVEEARDEFVMVELGAGFGRWSMRAAAALRKAGCRFKCVAVEAEPVHFNWMRQHFIDNDINPDELDLTWAAVGAAPGFVPFWVGEAGAWYGQAVANATDAQYPDVQTRRVLKVRSVLGKPPSVPDTGKSILWVPCTTVEDLIAPYPRIDLMDLDIQGLEFKVLEAAIDVLDAKVRRIHVGTHSARVEHDLRTLFTARGWQKRADYPCATTGVPTPYGDISFGDGVQSWVNPFLR